VISFVVHGRAQPGGSKRGFINRGAKGPRVRLVDANKNVGAWKDRVALAAATAMDGAAPMSGPLLLVATVFLVRPKGHWGKKGLLPSAPSYPAVKPDLTKYVRALEDALKGIVWRDDSQVVEHMTKKRYADSDRVVIQVSEIAAPAFEQVAR